MKSSNLSWRVNNEIRASLVRVIGSDGKQIGVLPKEKALKLAQKEGLDLIEIAPNATPPVTKIISLGKLRYQEEKRKRQEVKKTKASELKEIRLSPFIADKDYQTRLGRIKEFLLEKNKVRVVVVFRANQMGSRRFGYEILAKVKTELGKAINIDMEPKFIGRHLIMTISPTKQVIILNKNVKTKDEKISNKKI